jgi:pyruvate dehydrogenase E1 component beta subunit
MGRTVADTIRELTLRHVEEHDGLVLGQCLAAVGWVQNTVPPNARGLVELPMTDVAGPGFAVGAALMGRRPIFIVRFQSFLWLAASPLVNYAAKSQELFGVPCPVFVRAIAAEGGGAGPVHSSCYHSIFMHMPGLPVCAPMTPDEYAAIFDWYMAHASPLIVSEHRRSYGNAHEMPDIVDARADIAIFALSAARFSAVEAVLKLAAEGIRASLVHLVWLKPCELSPRVTEPLLAAGRGLVVDAAYEIAGACRSIAYDLAQATGCPVAALGIEDRSPGVARRLENGTPSPDRIAARVRALVHASE